MILSPVPMDFRASRGSALELVCHTEMQRIDGHAQTPLQLARVDEARYDRCPKFPLVGINIEGLNQALKYNS